VSRIGVALCSQGVSVWLRKTKKSACYRFENILTLMSLP
jgi:hypothetical protein